MERGWVDLGLGKRLNMLIGFLEIRALSVFVWEKGVWLMWGSVFLADLVVGRDFDFLKCFLIAIGSGFWTEEPGIGSMLIGIRRLVELVSCKGSMYLNSRMPVRESLK